MPQTIVQKGHGQEFVSVYASNTATANLVQGRLVALRSGGTVAADTGDGTSWGYAVDYPTDTTSVMIGIAWNSDITYTTCKALRPMLAICKGVVEGVGFTGSSTVGFRVQGGPDGADLGYVGGLAANETYAPGTVGISLTATTTNAAHTGTCYIQIPTL